jgi:hypothetical protein
MKDPFKTSDTSLAAYLHYKNHQFIGIMQDPNDLHRKVFVFIEQEDTEPVVEEYQSNQIIVHPKLYYKSIRIMHRMLRDGKVIEK